MKIIYKTPEGGVAVVTPASGQQSANLVSKVVPYEAEYQIVSRDFVFPVDQIFRDAWTWEGKNKPVLENLESSKAIAIAVMRDQTIADTKAAAEASFFGDPVNLDEAALKTLYVSTEGEVAACTDVYALKCLLCAFMDWDDPELPRDEQLKAKAEEAAAKLRQKIEDLKRQIRFRIAIAKKKKEILDGRPSTLPAPIDEAAEQPSTMPADKPKRGKKKS